MTGYDKKVVYFDLMENEQRIRNAGFAKVIFQSGQLRLTTNISGLHKTDTMKAEILFEIGKNNIRVDTIHIKEGRCIYSRLFTEDELKSLDVEWRKIYSACISLGEKRKLIAVINPSAQFVAAEDKCIEDKCIEDKCIEDKCIEDKCIEKQELIGDSEEQIEQLLEAAEHTEEASEYNLETAKFQEELPEGREVWLHDDKWKQLEDIFPHVHPFGDGREFLSIKPKDFVVLTKEYQCLANNSFLLHGFYNYHHIILGKIVDRVNGNSNTEKFYIGVPGVFYEREKTVALMFGFESFGCSREPAETGTFGYYMKRVEI